HPPAADDTKAHPEQIESTFEETEPGCALDSRVCRISCAEPVSTSAGNALVRPVPRSTHVQNETPNRRSVFQTRTPFFLMPPCRHTNRLVTSASLKLSRQAPPAEMSMTAHSMTGVLGSKMSLAVFETRPVGRTRANLRFSCTLPPCDGADTAGECFYRPLVK